MLYSRYGAGARDVLLMPFVEGIELIETAQRANNEEKLFMRWAVSYQTSMSYEDFKQKLGTSRSGPEGSETEEEIFELVKDILGG